jgi:hypothetical protein
MAFIVSGGVAGLPPGGSAGVVPEVSEPVPEGQTTRA